NASSEHSPSGQLAGQQGEQVAAVLSDVLEGKTPKKPKPIRLRGTLGSLGKSDGFGNVFSQSLTGLLPRITKSESFGYKNDIKTNKYSCYPADWITGVFYYLNFSAL